MINAAFEFMPAPAKAELSQWFTPSDAARHMARIAGVRHKRVLEPSCGSGNLIAAKARAPQNPIFVSSN